MEMVVSSFTFKTSSSFFTSLLPLSSLIFDVWPSRNLSAYFLIWEFMEPRPPRMSQSFPFGMVI